MIPLNLPDFKPNLKFEQQKTLIYDVIRKKFVVLTPEEYVRQHVIHYIINQLGYPLHQINVEKMITFNQTKRRVDIVVFNQMAQTHIIVECKAADIPLTENTARQIGVYQYALPCNYLFITNGINHFAFEKKILNEQIHWQKIEVLPRYGLIL